MTSTGSKDAAAAYVPRPERVTFEETKLPQDFLRWLNAYTNDQRGDDELHALCSWAHSIINALSLEGGGDCGLPTEVS